MQVAGPVRKEKSNQGPKKNTKMLESRKLAGKAIACYSWSIFHANEVNRMGWLEFQVLFPDRIKTGWWGPIQVACRWLGIVVVFAAVIKNYDLYELTSMICSPSYSAIEACC